MALLPVAAHGYARRWPSRAVTPKLSRTHALPLVVLSCLSAAGLVIVGEAWLVNSGAASSAVSRRHAAQDRKCGRLGSRRECRRIAVAASRQPAQAEGLGLGSIVAALSKAEEDEDEIEFRHVREGAPDDVDAQAAVQAQEPNLARQFANMSLELGLTTRYLPEVLEGLGIGFVGATGTILGYPFGNGRIIREVLLRLDESARVVAFDVNTTAFKAARTLEKIDPRFTLMQRPLGCIADVADTLVDTEVEGVVLDLAHHIKVELEGPLDLRWDPQVGISAAQWLRNVTFEELAWVFRNDPAPTDPPVVVERVAQAIIDHRDSEEPLAYGRDLCEVIRQARQSIPLETEEDDPAQQVVRFQGVFPYVYAIRSFLNQEAVQLQRALEGAITAVAYHRRIVVICGGRPHEEQVRAFVNAHEEPDSNTSSRLNARRRRELYPLLGTALDYSVKLVHFHGTIPSTPDPPRRHGPKKKGSVFVLEKLPRVGPQVKAAPRKDATRFQEPSAACVRGPSEEDLKPKAAASVSRSTNTKPAKA